MIGLKTGTVKIIPFDETWEIEFIKEKEILDALIGKFVIDIQHIESTSIKNCCAKPIIDIAIAVANLVESNYLIKILQNCNYKYKGEAGIPGRYFFAKGSSENRTHYIHIEEWNGRLWYNHIVFRDYLKRHPDLVLEYNNLKKILAEKYKENREDYSKQKDEFINSIIKKGMVELKYK